MHWEILLIYCLFFFFLMNDSLELIVNTQYRFSYFQNPMLTIGNHQIFVQIFLVFMSWYNPLIDEWQRFQIKYLAISKNVREREIRFRNCLPYVALVKTITFISNFPFPTKKYFRANVPQTNDNISSSKRFFKIECDDYLYR